MARTKGTLPLSANFEPQIAGPLDARFICGTVAELLLATTWTAKDGNIYAYQGMPVSVWNDGVNNGIYQLIASDYTNSANWVKSGGGGSVEAGEDGREVEIRNSGTYIQWRYAGDTEWTNIVLLSSLKGETGLIGLTWMGAYNPSTSYTPTHLVTYAGSGYVCNVATQGNLPTDTAYWELLVLEGAPGYTPQKGIDYFDGEDGEDGLTTSVKIGATTYSHNNGLITLPAYPSEQEGNVNLILGVIAVHPTYIAPTSSITNVTQTLEIGATLAVAITQSFIQGDSGGVTSQLINKNGSLAASAASFSESLTVVASTTYNGTVSYAQGGIKNNNIGIPDSVGRINAGTVTSATRTVVGKYRRYFGPCTNVPTDRATALALSNDLDTNNSITLVTGTTALKFVVLLPYNRTISLVTGQLGAVITSDYVLVGQIDINDAGGVARSYNKYVKTNGGAYSTSQSHIITIV